MLKTLALVSEREQLQRARPHVGHLSVLRSCRPHPLQLLQRTESKVVGVLPQLSHTGAVSGTVLACALWTYSG